MVLEVDPSMFQHSVGKRIEAIYKALFSLEGLIMQPVITFSGSPPYHCCLDKMNGLIFQSHPNGCLSQQSFRPFTDGLTLHEQLGEHTSSDLKHVLSLHPYA